MIVRSITPDLGLPPLSSSLIIGFTGSLGFNHNRCLTKLPRALASGFRALQLSELMRNISSVGVALMFQA